MPRSVESPEAAQFPERSKNLGAILDAITLRHFTDNLILFFRSNMSTDSFSEGSQYINGMKKLNLQYEIEKFLAIIDKTQNPFAVSECIRLIYLLDELLIESGNMSHFFLQRIEVDKLIEGLFQSEIWAQFVAICNDQGSNDIPLEFLNYQQDRFWTQKEQLRTLFGQELKALNEKFQKRQHYSIDVTDDDIELHELISRFKGEKCFDAFSLIRLVEIASRLGDIEKIIQLIDLHFDQDLMFSYSNVDGDVRVRENVEKLISALLRCDSEYVTEMVNNGFSENERWNSLHVVMISAYYLKDIKTFFKGLTEFETKSSEYKAYMLELFAQLLHDPQIDLTVAARKMYEDYLIQEIKDLDANYRIMVLRTFQHIELLQTCFEIIINEWDKNIFDEEELKVVINFYLDKASKTEQEKLRSYISSQISKQIRAEGTGENLNDASFGKKLEAAVLVAIKLSDKTMLDDAYQLASLYLEKSGVRDDPKKAIIKALPSLIEYGNLFVVNELVKFGKSLYQELEEIALAEYVNYDKHNLQFLFSSLPIMLNIFELISIYHPEMKIELTRGEQVEILEPNKVVMRTLEYFEWIHRGTEMFRDGSFTFWHENSYSRKLASALLAMRNHEVTLKVKKVMLAESIRLHEMGEYSSAYFFAEPLLDYIGRERVTEEELIQFLSFSNLNWITDKLMPHDVAFPLPN